MSIFLPNKVHLIALMQYVLCAKTTKNKNLMVCFENNLFVYGHTIENSACYSISRAERAIIKREARKQASPDGSEGLTK